MLKLRTLATIASKLEKNKIIKHLVKINEDTLEYKKLNKYILDGLLVYYNNDKLVELLKNNNLYFGSLESQYYSFCKHYHGNNLFDAIKYLFNKGLDINFKLGGNNCLHLVCKYYHGDDLLDIIKYLVNKGLDINANSGAICNMNYLHALCRFYNGCDLFNIIKYLVDKGIDINATSRIGRNMNCLHLLCWKYSGDDLFNIIKYLINKGVDINAKTNEMTNYLHLICSSYSGYYLLDIIKYLVNKGVDINTKNKYDYNCLHLNIINNYNIDVVDYLLGYIDLYSKNIKYKSAYYYLLRYRKSDISNWSKILNKHGYE